jgi:hypothetical protein
MERHSTELNELAAALSKAQGEMAECGKGAFNNFYKSKYALLEEIIRTSRPALTKNGFSIIQTVNCYEGYECLITTLLHTSGQWISSKTYLKPEKPGDIKSYGSAMTYLRRYALTAIIGLVVCDDPTDDDGGAPPYISDQDIEALRYELNGFSGLQKQLETRYKEIKLIPVGDVDMIFKEIEKQKAKSKK